MWGRLFWETAAPLSPSLFPIFFSSESSAMASSSSSFQLWQDLQLISSDLILKHTFVLLFLLLFFFLFFISLLFYKNGPTSASFCFIFVAFRQHFTEKNVGFSGGIRTQIVKESMLTTRQPPRPQFLILHKIISSVFFVISLTHRSRKMDRLWNQFSP